LDKSLFRYIWRFSKREQLAIFAVVIASLPFYFWSLELPKRIVNEAIQGGAFTEGRTEARFFIISFDLPPLMGGGTIELFEGFSVDQLGLLFGLSTLFLTLVLINGAFKYVINVAKGALGERMLRRLRFDLFATTLRFMPSTLRTVKSSETATIIKDEVEPIGGFIGDAFVQPLFLGTQAATAMAFILIQNVWLGLLAAAVVGVQFVIIPRMRRVQLRLGKERQIASRKLAGRIAEIVDGMEAVHVHDATAWEKAEIGDRLHHLFDLRFRIYKWKFMVKFINNLLAQITPFLFYAIGGYLALKGQLDIGQLVAVIGAYRDLPPPLKELIDWDQQRLDVQIKYDQIIQQFLPDKLVPLDVFVAQEKEDGPLAGPIAAERLRIADPHGSPIVEEFSFTLPFPVRLAIIGDGGPGPSTLARVLARRHDEYAGRVTIGGRDLGRISEGQLGRHLAYAGPEPALFPGSLRENLIYGLRNRPIRRLTDDGPQARRRRMEAERTGNPIDRLEDEWIDYERLGVEDADGLDGLLLGALGRIGMREDVYRFGLLGRVSSQRMPDLAEKVVEARRRLRSMLAEQGLENLVEPFDPGRYNAQASIGENLLFGVAVGPAFTGRGRAVNPVVRKALDRGALMDDLVAIGARITETMTEIFRDLPPGHPLFEQFSFIDADELPEFEDILRHVAAKGLKALNSEDRARLLALALDYIEPRHRLGLLDDRLRQAIVAARVIFRTALDGSVWARQLDLYDPESVCDAAPLRENLLFGRIAHGIADAQSRVMRVVSAVVDELGLREEVEKVGLGFQVGPGGRLLAPHQRAGVNLVRCLVKKPDIFILDGGLAAYGEEQARHIREGLLATFENRCFVAVLRDEEQAEGFDALIVFDGARAELRRSPAAGREGREADAAAANVAGGHG